MSKLNNKLIIILIIVALILLAGIYSFVNNGFSIGNKVSAQTVGEKTIKYINENLLVQGTTASLISISDMGNVYKVRLAIKENDNVLGEFDSYISKDGGFLFPEGYNMNEPIDQGVADEETDEIETSPLSQEELEDFIGCLSGANFVIYGANWCGWTQQLVSMLGGPEIINPIYVECTEKADLCEEKEILGYPTILINGQPYEGGRTFEDFSETTGCKMPEGAENLGKDNTEGGC